VYCITPSAFAGSPQGGNTGMTFHNSQVTSHSVNKIHQRGRQQDTKTLKIEQREGREIQREEKEKQ